MICSLSKLVGKEQVRRWSPDSSSDRSADDCNNQFGFIVTISVFVRTYIYYLQRHYVGHVTMARKRH